MKIQTLRISNFRGFEDKSFRFDDRMNVVLGNNTTGKTTLLHAVQIALGAFLQSMSLLPGGKAFSRNFKKGDQVSRYSASSKSFLLDVNKPLLEVDATFYKGIFQKESNSTTITEESISWARSGNKLSKATASELQEEVAWMENTRRTSDETGENALFPLILSFGAARLEKNYRMAEKTKSRESREEKAYKCALDEQVDFKGAFDWIYRYDKSVAKGSEFAGTDVAFLTAIKEAIPAIKQIFIDTKNEEFTAQIKMAKDKEPYWLTYDMMSAGFKAMINIVAEMAHRCIELNGFLGIDAVKKTPGIVMVDELDLYLHPHWQQHILEDLQNAFPMIQFIVTTHSPFIVQSVNSRNVITLDGRVGDGEPRMRSIEDIAVTEMNMDSARFPRYNLMVDMAEKYYQLVKEGKEGTKEADSIKKELDAIEEMFSDDPAYVALLRAERRSQ